MQTFYNGQTHLKNLRANAARCLKCIWPLYDVMQFVSDHFIRYSATAKQLTSKVK